jgi:ribonuclease Z
MSTGTVSGTLLQIPGQGNILLEAGEGTWGQLVRHFGLDGAKQVLRDLKCIFISHIHGDHHIGLAKILSTRRKVSLFILTFPIYLKCLDLQLQPAPTEPVYLITLPRIFLYLHEYNEIEDLGFDDPGSGVIPVLSDILNRNQTSIRPQCRSHTPPPANLPWLDRKT